MGNLPLPNIQCVPDPPFPPSTPPANDSHFFARLQAEDDPSVYAQVHPAGPDGPPFAVRTWRKANPALAYGLPAIEALRAAHD